MRTTYFRWMGALALLVLLVSFVPHEVYAADEPVCTDFAALEAEVSSGKEGILTNITNFIKETIMYASEDLFYAFTDSDAYQNAVYAAATLMIVIYAVSFTIGISGQASFSQVLVRLIKLGLIFTVISPDGWVFFSDYVVRFFNDGTDELIGGVIEIGTGIPYTPGGSPFIAIDGIANYVISPDMIVAILGSFLASGPYGLAMGVLMSMATMGLLKLLINALRVYAVSFILRALLLGVAPVFIVFLLFEKTKPMFAGWVNALVNLSLQPILLFTFLSFFLVLISTATTDMLGSELCWTEYQSTEGTANKKSFWRFKKVGDSYPDITESDWQGSIACKLSGGGDCQEFPINILDLLTFMILVYVAGEFSKVVEKIANDISNTFVSVGQATKIDMLSGMKGGGEGGGINPRAGGASDRGTRGGR